MDVTPQELRSSEIKEAWRGYHRDEVDELLERAAVTIENLGQQLATAGSSPSPESTPVNRDDAEISHRTLLLAQRAADEAVSEAQAQARKLVEESEARAQSLVSEAETSARRIAESERRRLESELSELAAKRDARKADADALEEYASAYRERVRAAIEADLDRLGNGAIDAPGPRPELHEVDVSAPAPAALEPEPAREAEPEPERGGSSYEGPDTRAISIDSGGQVAEPTSSAVAAPPRPVDSRPSEPEWPPAPQASTAAAPTSGWLAGADDWAPVDTEDAPLPWERSAAPEPFTSETAMEATAIDGDALDDDAFFASLRDAVRADEFGGRDDEPMPFFDDELADDRRRGFRRRR